MIHFQFILKDLNEIESIVKAHHANTVKLSREQLADYFKQVQKKHRLVTEYWQNMNLSDFHNATELCSEISKKVYSLESLILSVKEETVSPQLIWSHDECLNVIRT